MLQTKKYLNPTSLTILTMDRHIETVTLTSKGQLVIPQEIRKEMHLAEGDKLLLFKEHGMITLKPVKKLGKEIEEDLIEMKLAAEGWKDIEAGRFTEYKNVDDFLKDMKKW